MSELEIFNNPEYGEGVNVTTKTTKLTGKGQIYFINKFKGESTDDKD